MPLEKIAAVAIPLLQKHAENLIQQRADKAKEYTAQQAAELQKAVQGDDPFHAFLRGFVTGFALSFGFV